MKRMTLLLGVLLAFAAQGVAAKSYAAKGLVLKVDAAHNSVIVSCDRIQDFMEPMAMPFSVHDAKELAGLAPGTMIEFTLVVNKDSSYIENVHIHKYEGLEQDPIGARRLKLMTAIAAPDAAAHEVKVGEQVPDFSLIDQNNQPVRLSQFNGKVVALTFTYTRCALPNFCFRIANHFRQLEKRFADRMGTDLILLTITFDPVHDTPEVMAKYGKTWNADPKNWRLLTGPSAEVARAAGMFGVSYFADEGLMVHSLHTIVIDREGRLVANLEGNEFTTAEVGDLVETVLRGKTPRGTERTRQQ